MPTYPLPDKNPNCQCRGNFARAFFCQFGHMLECHFPYDCGIAGCSHLGKYDFEPEQVKEMEEIARAKIIAGNLPPYALDENNNIIVRMELLE